jgi:hypothetical protein
MKTEIRTAWEKQKERARVIARYLKRGGRYIVAHPPGHRNHSERREDAKRSRRILRALNKATRTGRDPLKVLRRFGRKPQPIPRSTAPIRPTKTEEKGVLGRIRNLFRKGNR